MLRLESFGLGLSPAEPIPCKRIRSSNVVVAPGVPVGVIVVVASLISIIAGVAVDKIFSLAWSEEEADKASVMVVYVIWVGVPFVAPIVLKFNVPSLVVVTIALVGSAPIETEAARVLLVVIGPSIVCGKALALGTKLFAASRASMAGSYFIWNFTKVTIFDFGLTMIFIERGSPTFF